MGNIINSAKFNKTELLFNNNERLEDIRNNYKTQSEPQNERVENER